MSKLSIPVSKRALVARINRKLAEQDQVLKFTRGARAKLDLGDAYIWKPRRAIPGHTFVDVEDLGRELGVLQKWERLIDEDH